VQVDDLYPIVSSCGLDDCMIDMDELFRIARPIILVDVPSLEFLWADDLSEWWSQVMETAL
jgi:hypothetical protein